jgi:hypothetical protein
MDEIEQRERESREDPDTKYEQERETEEAVRDELADDVADDELEPSDESE